MRTLTLAVALAFLLNSEIYHMGDSVEDSVFSAFGNLEIVHELFFSQFGLVCHFPGRNLLPKLVYL